MARGWSEHWRALDGWYTAASWTGWLFLWLTGLTVGGIVAWSFSQLTWFWTTFQWAGVISVFLVTWLMIPIGINLYRHVRVGEGTKLDPLLVGAVVGAIVLVGCLIGYSLKSTTASSSVTQGQILPAPANQSAQLIKSNPILDWTADGRIAIRGIYARSGGELIVYVTYGNVIGSALTPYKVLSGKIPHEVTEPRIKIDLIPRFDREEQVDITLGTITEEGNNNNYILQWGRADLKNKSVGLTFGNYFGWIICVERDHAETKYPFMILSRSNGEGKRGVPILISPNTILSHMEMGSDAPH